MQKNICINVNVVLHVLPWASFVTNNIFLLLIFTVTHIKTSNFDMYFQKFIYTCHFCFI